MLCRSTRDKGLVRFMYRKPTLPFFIGYSQVEEDIFFSINSLTAKLSDLQ